MKRLIFLFMCAFFCFSNIRGTEQPFAVLGYPTIIIWDQELENAKYPAFWHTYYHTYENDYYNLTNKIIGDSIVNGKTYGMMRFYYETKDELLTGTGLYLWGQPYGKTEFADTLLYRQDGDKVFCIPKGEKDEVMIVDYGLEVDEEFVDGSGEKFRVVEKRFLKDGYDTNWTTIGCCNVMCNYFYSEPKVVELVSLNSGEKDTWVEGIGSLHWGVVPMFIAKGIKPFSQLNQQPRFARVCVAAPENMTVMPNVNEEDYKAMLLTDCKYSQDEEPCLEYSFDADTLCVHGIQSSVGHFKLLYAECLITGKRIDFKLKQRDAFPRKNIIFNARIPGFKAGTYEVGMPGQEYVTLVCKGEAKETVSFTKDQMATIILPTEPDASKGKYYRLDRCEDRKIIFTEEAQPKAKVPYIIVPSEDFSIDLSTLDLEGLTQASVSVGGVSFIGSYSHAEYNCEEGYYIDIIDKTPDCHVDDANLRKATIGALRAYLRVNWDDPYGQGPTKGIRDKLEIVLEDNPNSIAEVKSERVKSEKYDDTVYDLQGRHLSGKPAIGLYIQNGKKVARP